MRVLPAANGSAVEYGDEGEAGQVMKKPMKFHSFDRLDFNQHDSDERDVLDEYL